MCNRRCCCPNYYARLLPETSTPTADRGLRVLGNTVNVVEPSSLEGIPAGLVGTPFGIDYRNALTFQEARLANPPAGYTTLVIYAEDMKLTQASRRIACSWNNRTGAAGGPFCADWYHQRLYFAKGVQASGEGTGSQQMEIRRVDYGGANESLLYANEYTYNGGANFSYQIGALAWEPRTNRVYFIEPIANTTSLSTNTSFGSTASYLRYVDADLGGGATTIVSYENIESHVGDTIRAINWFGLYATGGAIVTIEIETTIGGGVAITYLRVRDLGGNLAATIYAGTSRSIRRCKVCEKDGMIYFEESITTPSDKTIFWKTSFASSSEADWIKVFDTDAPGLFGKISPTIMGIGFGCRIEDMRGSYRGACYGLNV